MINYVEHRHRVGVKCYTDKYIISNNKFNVHVDAMLSFFHGHMRCAHMKYPQCILCAKKRLRRLFWRVNPYSTGIVFSYTSESNVCIRQILTYTDDPRTEKNKIYNGCRSITYRYSNEPERAN